MALSSPPPLPKMNNERVEFEVSADEMLKSLSGFYFQTPPLLPIPLPFNQTVCFKLFLFQIPISLDHGRVKKKFRVHE